MTRRLVAVDGELGGEGLRGDVLLEDLGSDFEGGRLVGNTMSTREKL